MNDEPVKKRHEKEHLSNTSDLRNWPSHSTSVAEACSLNQYVMLQVALSVNINSKTDRGRTHHDMPVETFWSDSDHQIWTNPFDNLTSTDDSDKAVRIAK